MGPRGGLQTEKDAQIPKAADPLALGIAVEANLEKMLSPNSSDSHEIGHTGI